MVRSTIGDSLFLATMQAYCQDTNLRFKSAIISDFNEKVNVITGKDYNWFFNEWIYQPNHPHYINTYSFNNIGNGFWNVDFYTTQVQTNAPFFQMPLEVRIHFQDNSDTLVTVMNDHNYQYASWNFNKRPVTFTFDPNNKIILKEQSTTLGINEPTKQDVGFHLFQNIPNPASNNTKIVYELSKPMHVSLDILDVVGKVIKHQKDIDQTTGKYSEEVDCSTLAPGIYYYRFQGGNASEIKKMVVTK